MRSHIPESTRKMPCPPTPERAEAIKNLRMIADDIEKGYGGFNFLVGYDFVNLPLDIISGESKRKAGD
jgi:hypothetical protein